MPTMVRKHQAQAAQHNPAAMGSEAKEAIERYHTHTATPCRCVSIHVQDVAAPLPAVWSIVRRFDRPQSYKGFVRNCRLVAGDGGVGSVREVHVMSGLPAETSVERLDVLDDDLHVFGFSIIGGDQRLVNYQSTTTLHRGGTGGSGTVVVESYVVDVPPGSTEEETRIFADTIVRCNLISLDDVANRMMMG